MTAEEIIAELNKQNIDEGELNDGVWRENIEEKLPNIGVVVLIQKNGGGEGGGSDVTRVFKFKDHNVFLKIAGYYSSYEGIEWDEGFKEVFPKEKLITIYEPI